MFCGALHLWGEANDFDYVSLGVIVFELGNAGYVEYWPARRGVLIVERSRATGELTDVNGGSHILEWQVTVPHWPMVGWRYTVMAMSPTTEG